MATDADHPLALADAVAQHIEDIPDLPSSTEATDQLIPHKGPGLETVDDGLGKLGGGHCCSCVASIDTGNLPFSQPLVSKKEQTPVDLWRLLSACDGE
jgi:hypothetical protein